uniref:WWE domain-containing protein n=1 Tax=Sinocyclocheilus rhinocerous TaxID=307959 RepID=A0A673G4D2_9TELE
MDTKLLASAVVVWEWLNEHGRWRPYSPAVSHHIEAVIRSDPRGGSVVLGRADSRLSPYIIDLHSMHQFRQDTGKMKISSAALYLWQATFTFILYNDLIENSVMLLFVILDLKKNLS